MCLYFCLPAFRHQLKDSFSFDFSAFDKTLAEGQLARMRQKDQKDLLGREEKNRRWLGWEVFLDEVPEHSVEINESVFFSHCFTERMIHQQK